MLVPQVISFTAPTGAGKTIITSALIEQIFCGSSFVPEQPNAIIVWLSDSPELNKQSRNKIETKADHIQIGQCITIEDESFDQEILEDGYIYFLNTQKLSKSSNLTNHGDTRQYTIWETLNNTINEKSDRLFMIIDEAHRGAKTNQTTIMQTFIKGNDKCKPMPVVIGMSATLERFNTLVAGTISSQHHVIVSPDEVRQSGLLKDLIEIYSPDDSLENKEMGVLQAATDEWRDKWLHWYQYCKEQHYKYVNPIFVVQVEAGKGNQISATDLNECLDVIEKRLNSKYMVGEVVHCFGDKSELNINGLSVPYIEPSRIQDDDNIRLVFFKESLSTGWDCPRAETMMSFRHAVDSTYIAQLLGRMIRTPMQMHIQVDESLNNVHLYLPHFNINTVSTIVNELQKIEGGNIPTDFIEESVGGNRKIEILSISHNRQQPVVQSYLQTSTGNAHANIATNAQPDNTKVKTYPFTQTNTGNVHDYTSPQIQLNPKQVQTDTSQQHDMIDREKVMQVVNSMSLLTYDVRTVRINDYANSLFKLAHLLTQSALWHDALNTIIKDVVGKIHDYIEHLKATGKYESMAEKVLEFKLTKKVFDALGEEIDNDKHMSLFTSSNADLERQFRQANTMLYNEGIGYKYGQYYMDSNDEDAYKIQFILYVGNEDCMKSLHNYAETKFHELIDNYRLSISNLPEHFRLQYDKIVSDGDIISKHNFRLPENINVSLEENGNIYTDHLFVNRNGVAKFKLNEWEEITLNEERQRNGFLCWLRNQPRKPWALCIPYAINNEQKPMYPDFIIFNMASDGTIRVSILEPHGEQYADSLPKAKGMADYARQNQKIERIQLIHVTKDSTTGKKSCHRLDLSKSAIQNKIMHLNTPDELNNLFITDGIVE
jgi:type III restriction enzyme